MKKILFLVAALLVAAVAGCGGGKIDSESVVDVPAIPSVPDDNPCDFQNVNTACVEYTREGAERGIAEAQFNLGVMYESGAGVARDNREAFRWFRAAAEQGDAEAQYNIGVMYSNGVGVTRDNREAFRWYLAAAEQGNAEAQFNLGVVYENGEGVAKDERESFRWYLAAAEQGNVEAQFNLSLMYYSGKGVAKDGREAFRWSRTAAERGHAKAQAILGAMYYDGEVVAEDNREAYIWFSIANANGNKAVKEILQKDSWKRFLTPAEIGSAKREAVQRYEEIESRKNNTQVSDDYEAGKSDEYPASFFALNSCLDNWQSRECAEFIHESAEQGDAEAQYILGLMYYNGSGVIKDEREAYIWFSIANANGNKEAEKILLEDFWKRLLTPAGIRSTKHEVVRRLDEIESRKNSAQSSEDYETGNDENVCSEEITNPECVNLIHAGANLGFVEMQYALGVMHFRGEGVAEDNREAYIWFSIANANGNKEAEKILLEDFWKRLLTPAGIRSAKHEVVRRLDEIESRKNNVQNSDDYETGKSDEYPASFIVPSSCLDNWGSRECVEFVREAAEQGYAEAQYYLGVMYYNGEGVASDYGEAFRWYRAAAKQGYVAAQFNLGLMYYEGKGVAKDYSEAFRWFHAVAEQGYAKAQFILGSMYDNGEGVASDYDEALRWYLAAAEQEHALAQNNLGLMYENGKGVAKNEREALRWYLAAAEHGNMEAQFNLGGMYYNGEGVASDYGEALRWYLAAAEQGDADAQFILGVMYYKGEGVVEDEHEAYIWLLIAKAGGSEDADKMLQKAFWQKYLTSAEIKSAELEAARRFEKIKNRNNSAQNSDTSQKLGGEYALAKPPKQKNIAAKVFENTWRSVVMIEDSVGQGGGVVIRPNLVATNCHVVDGGEIAVYKPENRQIKEDSPFDAKVVHRNELHDFCILEVEGLWAIPATIRKYETLQVGENVYALGAPQGFDLSLSEGLISQLRKGDEGKRYIQTDAAISPGSSGGGLFDVDGNFIGILTGKNTDEGTEGIGFAIPADLSLEF